MTTRRAVSGGTRAEWRPSLGSVGDRLHGRVAGIDQAPDSVGYRHLVLRPTVGGRLTWANARYGSPRACCPRTVAAAVLEGGIHRMTYPRTPKERGIASESGHRFTLPRSRRSPGRTSSRPAAVP